MPICRYVAVFALALSCSGLGAAEPEAPNGDYLRDIQTAATRDNRSPIAHWGYDPENYRLWSTHSNRLIPIYTFGTKGSGAGIDLSSYTGANSRYRDAAKIRDLFGYDPPETLNPAADYCDQTDIYRLQKAAFDAGRKYIFLIIFDGMDWQTTRAAAIYNARDVKYDSGRGTGLHFQDYTAGGTSQFGSMVTSPHNEGTDVDVNLQTVKNPDGNVRGGYSTLRAGPDPWSIPTDPQYPIAKPDGAPMRHAYTDSSSSAQSMTTGTKTYNNGVNVDFMGRQVATIAHEAQANGYAVGAVTSVPISHATPAAAYAHNVHRDDYQDLTRDMLGLRSIAHPERPLPGQDVVIGAGWGMSAEKNEAQGLNFVPGNIYLTDADRKAVDVRNGGNYVVATRRDGQNGKQALLDAAQEAASKGRRLLGFFGTKKGHLPFATANGDFTPAPGKSEAEVYTPEDLAENPTLVDMTEAAIAVLSKNPKGFWLMVEAGDVDWANHNNNIDDSIGAVLSGDAAVKTVTDWVEKHSHWRESLVIVTADHGHYLVIEQPEKLIPPAAAH